MKQKNLKLAVLLFALTFAVGAAFAATNGMLAFGGTVRINNVVAVEEARLEFTSTRINCAFGQASSEIVVIEGRQHLTYETVIDFNPNYDFPTVMSQVDFTIQNTGNVPVEFLHFEYDIALGQLVDVTLTDNQGQHLHMVMPTSSTHPQSGSLIIEPGASVTGQLLFNPLASIPGPFPSDFEELMFNHNFSLAYQQFR